MQSKLVAVLLVAAVRSATAVMVNAPANATVSTKLAAKAPVTTKVTAEEVAKLHHKMETIAMALEGMLKPNQPKSLANLKVAPAFRLFVSELRTTLAATAAPKDLPVAMTKLKNAQAGMADLTKALNAQQESLMHDDVVEETNLLLGVLMVRKAEPMAKQLEVLSGADFSKLPVSKALLAKHDEKTPLVQQVAMYMDAHSAVAGSSSKAEVKAQRLAKTAAFFGQRVTKMEHEEEVMERAYKRQAAKVDALIKKSGNTTAKRLQASKKRLDREYKKKLAVHHQQLQVMKDVVAAVHRGDAAALKKAQAALMAHLQAMKAHTGSFLYLLQLGHRLAEKDCPFCVAQCIGKCHDGGSPYAQCMTQCATAGQ